MNSLYRKSLLLGLAATAATAIAGCDGIGFPGDPTSPTPSGGNSTAFAGYFVGDGTSGKLSIQISTNNPVAYLPGPASQRSAAGHVAAFGRLHAAADTTASHLGIYLSGSYRAANDTLYLAGGGYTLTGRFYGAFGDPDRWIMKGTLSTPGGQSGIFRCLYSADVGVFCGSYASTSGQTIGPWILATNSNALIGVALPTGAPSEDAIEFDGIVRRTDRGEVIDFSGGDPGVLDLTGTGTLDTVGMAAAGDWALDDAANINDDAGTWSGAPCH